MLITGKRSRKTLNMKTRKRKKKKTRNVIETQQDLRKICKRAHSTSLLHLSIAIIGKYKYFTTNDKSILRQTKPLAKKYKITICKSPYDIDNPEDLKKIAFEHGIYI